MVGSPVINDALFLSSQSPAMATSNDDSSDPRLETLIFSAHSASRKKLAGSVCVNPANAQFGNFSPNPLNHRI